MTKHAIKLAYNLIYSQNEVVYEEVQDIRQDNTDLKVPASKLNSTSCSVQLQSVGCEANPAYEVSKLSSLYK